MEGGVTSPTQVFTCPESHENDPLIISMQGAPSACVTTGVGSRNGREREKKKGRELKKQNATGGECC